MERVDIDIENVIVPVNDPDGLLKVSVHLDLLQPAVNPYAVVDMGYIIARLQFPEGTYR